MQNTQTQDSFSELVDKAEVLRRELETKTPQDAFQRIKAIVESHEIVLGVWPDASADCGVGQYIVKGADILQAIVERGEPERRSIVAIPCISYEQAIAASQTMGDASRAH